MYAPYIGLLKQEKVGVISTGESSFLSYFSPLFTSANNLYSKSNIGWGTGRMCSYFQTGCKLPAKFTEEPCYKSHRDDNSFPPEKSYVPLHCYCSPVPCRMQWAWAWKQGAAPFISFPLRPTSVPHQTSFFHIDVTALHMQVLSKLSGCKLSP